MVVNLYFSLFLLTCKTVDYSAKEMVNFLGNLALSFFIAVSVVFMRH